MKPRFEHDCDQCVFLGPFQGADLYVCNGTVLARLSDDPPDYKSGMEFAKSDPLLNMALRRAMEIGIDPNNWQRDSQ